VILELRSANVDAGDRRLVSDISLTIDSGGCTAIMGPSGSGKSTLLQLIAGIRQPPPSQVLVEGADLGSLSAPARDRLRLSRMGMVFQFGELLPELTAAENAALPARYLGVPRAAAESQAVRWLSTLGLGDLHDVHPDRLSGGQIQRVAIARALAHEPRLVLADEPTGMLDEETSAEVVDLLVSRTRESGAALVLVTHDRAVAAFADRILELRRGRLVAA
jgi:putative ABC transport system ATP-binding protein